MARSLWSGSLSFGLVNVPVALFSATRDRDVHFRELHEPDRSPIETHRVSAADGSEVPWEEVGKGYELDDGRWVLLTEEDLQAAAPRQSKTIDIERFVQEREIDPLYFDQPYLLAPSDEGAARAYALLNEVMGASGQVALGRFVMRAKQRMVSIRSRAGALTLTTMKFHDEVRSPDEIVAAIEGGKPPRKEVEQAIAIIEELGVAFDPTNYRDEHRAHLQAIVKRKQQGKKIPAPPQPPQQPTVTAPDLMGALEQSLAQIKAGKQTQTPAGKKTQTPAGKKPRAPAEKKARTPAPKKTKSTASKKS
jgi:DNA end-binding protein Ku